MKNAYDEVLDFIKDPKNMVPEKEDYLGNAIPEVSDGSDTRPKKFLYVLRRIHKEMSFKACVHLLKNHFNSGGSVYYEVLRGYLLETVGGKGDVAVKKEESWTSREGKLCDSDYVVHPVPFGEQSITILGDMYNVVVTKSRSIGDYGEGEYEFIGLPPVECFSKSSRAKVKAGEQVRFITIVLNSVMGVGDLLVAFKVGSMVSHEESTIVAHYIEAEAEVWKKIFRRLAAGFDTTKGRRKKKKKPDIQESNSEAVSKIVLSHQLYDKLRRSGIITELTTAATSQQTAESPLLENELSISSTHPVTVASEKDRDTRLAQRDKLFSVSIVE